MQLERNSELGIPGMSISGNLDRYPNQVDPPPHSLSHTQPHASVGVGEDAMEDQERLSHALSPTVLSPEASRKKADRTAVNLADPLSPRTRCFHTL